MIKSTYHLPLAITVLAATVLSLNAIKPLQTTSAQTKDSTSSANEETDPVVTNNVRKLILDQVSQNKIRGVSDAEASTHRRAVIGEVQRVTDEAITIRGLDRQHIIALTKTLLLRNNNVVKVSDIAVGNWVTVLGSITETEINADFMLVSTNSLLPNPQYVSIGTITEITRTSITIQPRDSDSERALTITTATDLEDPDGNRAVLSDFEEDMTVLVTGIDSNDKITAKTIRSLAPLEAVVETL